MTPISVVAGLKGSSARKFLLIGKKEENNRDTRSNRKVIGYLLDPSNEVDLS
jgi:hypothetical protein